MADAAPLILIVDDEPPFGGWSGSSLGDEGYRVAEAESGSERCASGRQQPPDVVILDLGLPDVDGQTDAAATSRMAASTDHHPLSARSEKSRKSHALDSGADDYLLKPFSTAELLARIRVALRHANGEAANSASTFESATCRLDFAKRQVRVARPGDAPHADRI